MKNGFALLIALIISSILLVVGVGVAGIGFREMRLASFSSQSEIAFFAAETGLECGLYWDKAQPFSTAVPLGSFATSTFVNNDSDPFTSEGGTVSSMPLISCAASSFSGFSYSSVSATIDEIKFTINNPYVNMTIQKEFPTGSNKQDDARATTTITATGYNTSDSTNPRRVGRRQELKLMIR